MREEIIANITQENNKNVEQDGNAFDRSNQWLF